MSEPTVRRYADPAYPAWIREIDLALPVRPQFVVTGNLRDNHLLPLDHPRSPQLVPTVDILVDCLSDNGYHAVLLYDPVDGIQVAHESEDGTTAKAFPGVKAGATTEITVSKLGETLKRMGATQGQGVALIVDYASRMRAGDQDVNPELLALFAAAEKFAYSAMAGYESDRRRMDLFSTVFWLVDREQDLPHWIAAAEPVRVVSIPTPTLGTRLLAADRLARSLPGFTDLDEAGRAQAVIRFAELTEGMALRSMEDVWVLAVDSGIPAARLDEAVRIFRAGLPNSPWQDPELRKRIVAGQESIGSQVLGQQVAVQRSIDILVRSAVGLTGAHSSGHPGRPQGILFFAGPTGVGKTELAKQLARLVFGTPDAYTRFDMSEFTAEQSEARLIGSPPGFIGHDAGGELTNAVRQKPFSLLLFDEVEKAHPRILDKFLQILEDGRLTDGSGSTVYFSETIIVFTSNLGVVETTPTGDRVLLVQPGEPYEEIDRRVRKAISDHFVKRIQRPELLNRIGENNVIVFDFISREIGRQLVDKYIDNIVERVHALRGVDLLVNAEVREAVAKEALGDLSFGGRGIGNRVENAFVNPLARALFERDGGGGIVTVVGLEQVDHAWRVVLE